MARLELAPVVIVGIDLGTTFSAVATVDPEGRPVALANRVGELTTPSVVHFESASSVLLGAAAAELAAVDPDNTVSLVKRLMGTDVELRFHGVPHTPESVSALILRGMVADAAAELGASGPARAVITVPAYFGIREREATLQAAGLAGIEVLELLSEPVAAALHYRTSGVSQVRDGAVLVYDLGGGTFDTTVLRVSPAGMNVVATDGDSQLGGADWDERIADYLTAAFVRAVDGRVDPDEDDGFPQQIRSQAERAKRALSTATARPVTVRCYGTTATVEFDRTILAGLGADLTDRTMAIVRRTLDSAAAKGIARIDEVVLVGGSTRMPAVAAAVQQRLGMRPKLVEPDFAVVFGAAVRAHQLAAADASRATSRPAGAGSGAPAHPLTSAVVPRSFGVLLDDSDDPSGQRQFVRHVVHRNEALPAEASVTCATIVDGQDRIRVQIFEQAGDVPAEELGANRRVLDGQLALPSGLPAGSPIEITLRVSADGLLSLVARDRRGGPALACQAYVDGVVDAARTRQLAESLTGLVIR
jgi:molecular chaperone DnaK (HSP70)